jgi:hypothetical protein
MTDVERDPMLRRALEELRKVPPPDVAAIRRVVAAAAAARVTPIEGEPDVVRVPRGRSIRLWMAVGIAAASAFVGFTLRGAWISTPDAVPVAAGSSTVQATRSALRTVATTELEPAAIPHQFVFNSSHAHRVSVVGDFNRWNPASTPMTSDGELWSVTIPIVPGRHMYAFMVDDSLFTLDPTAPKARDPDLGADGSIVIVGRP